MYCRGARAVLVVFDVASEQLFNEANLLLSDFREHGVTGSIVVGVQNKVDLSERKVSAESIQKFCYQHLVDFIQETSTLTGDGVTKLFAELGRRILALRELN
jgi:GTPase SAR1 family protein